MGLFLAMSGIAGASRSAVEEALKDYARLKGGDFGPDTENEEFPDVMVVEEAGNDRITVLYPGAFMEWDKASAHLAHSLSVPVFSFHIHDEDLWMYTLFAEGEEVDHFTPIPDYWFEDLPDQERELWAGNAEVVARYWPGVEAKAVENYLVTWDLDQEEPGKAYDDDEFEYHDCWQLVDFMRRLGLMYPLSGQGEALGTTYRFHVPDDPDGN